MSTRLTKDECQAILVALAQATAGELDGWDEGPDRDRVVKAMFSAQVKLSRRLE